GKDIANFPTKEATKEKIANAMVGRAVLFTTERPEVEIGEVVLSVKDVSVKDHHDVIKVNNASFEIRKGEVLGIAGVEGSGQTELVEALTGLKEIYSGEMILDNVILKKKTPRKISQLGLAHIPEDRHKRAAVSQFSVMENFALGLERDEYSKFGLLNFSKLRKDAEMFMEKYDVRPRSVDTEFGRLSGGNQQKIIVARELEKKNNNLIIAGQPTRGVDIGAIESIHKLILNEKAKGKAVMVVSSELSEILNLSDKIAVMCAGKITGILSREEANEEKIGILMAGGKLD
ncbi:MAG: ATP-binding cassette domain-containing protein, partial [Cetobacterium sp.]